jgi:hypothetical protein
MKIESLVFDFHGVLVYLGWGWEEVRGAEFEGVGVLFEK